VKGKGANRMRDDAPLNVVAGRCRWCREIVAGEPAASQRRSASLVIVTSGRRTHCLLSARPVAPLAKSKVIAPALPTPDQLLESAAA
jgi:hypothetical protein